MKRHRWKWNEAVTRGTCRCKAQIKMIGPRNLVEDAKIIDLRQQVVKLKTALTIIMKWDRGTFPRVADLKDPTKSYAYHLAYGSNGERDWMRAIAAEALGFDVPGQWRLPHVK